MAKTQQTAISPTREADYPEWYQQVITEAELAESSAVRGCMVIRPWGYAIWENIQAALDARFKETGHENAYFPLFVPLSYLEKEAEHVEGFAKECAVVTHHRLEANDHGNLIPAGKLDEPLVVRPTSETIIGATYARWVQSYRDLPIMINQWANVVRWEMRTRLFLRTTEFLWQEGHTAHESREEAWKETLDMLEVYRAFAEEYLAIPVVTGEKTVAERFPGAENTFCIEAMMQDRKALQAGTSHFLGQNFARASGIQYQGRNGKQAFAWTTSWGVSTRLVGGLVMAHGDDDGLVLPPRMAPKHVAILPIVRKEDDRPRVMAYCEEVANSLKDQTYSGKPVAVVVDDRDLNAGDKGWHWVKKGIPLIVEVGPRDMAEKSVFVGRRDRSRKERFGQSREEFAANVSQLLDQIQRGLLDRARRRTDEFTQIVDSWNDFDAFFTPQNPDKPEIHGGFVFSYWCGNADCEARINATLAVSIRCIPLDRDDGDTGACIACSKSSPGRVVFAKSY